MAGEVLTLSEVARRLEVPQHRLIHLCEKGVVVPEIHDASGRGSSREFSSLNLLEFAVALRLREMFLPVGLIGSVVHVIRKVGRTLAGDRPGFSLVDDLRRDDGPDLRVILSDGKAVFLSLASSGGEPVLFGGLPIDALARPAAEMPELVSSVPLDGQELPGPEGSRFARLELSVSAVARALPLA